MIKKYRDSLKSKYPFLKTTNLNIGHTNSNKINKEQFYNSIIEFYIMTESKHIYYASESGFPIIAGKFNNVPITKI